MFHLTDRTRRGLAEAILIPGTLGILVAVLLQGARWLGVAA
jgi:hypothetical protein